MMRNEEIARIFDDVADMLEINGENFFRVRLSQCGPYRYCHQAGLVVEIDGSPHRQQQGYDRLRDAYLARFGIHMFRLANHSVRGNLPSVIYARS